MNIRSVLLFCLLVYPLIGSAQEKSRPASQSPDKGTAAASLPDSSNDKTAVDPEKEKDIRLLLEISGAKTRTTFAMAEMEKSIRPLMQKAFPEGEYREKLIEAFFSKFHSKMNPDLLLDMAVTSYDKHLSREEVKGLIQFYQSPLGKKTLEVLPQMMAELMNKGREIGAELGRQSMQEVLAEHPELQKQLEEAQKNAAH